MLRRTLPTLLVTTVVTLGALASACGGSQKSHRHHASHDEDDAEEQDVTLGKWCKVLGRVVCDRMAECAGDPDSAASCKETFLESCVAGRDAKADAGRTPRELEKCKATYGEASCRGYMDEVIAHKECRVKIR